MSSLPYWTEFSMHELNSQWINRNSIGVRKAIPNRKNELTWSIQYNKAWADISILKVRKLFSWTAPAPKNNKYQNVHRNKFKKSSRCCIENRYLFLGDTSFNKTDLTGTFIGLHFVRLLPHTTGLNKSFDKQLFQQRIINNNNYSMQNDICV